MKKNIIILILTAVLVIMLLMPGAKKFTIDGLQKVLKSQPSATQSASSTAQATPSTQQSNIHDPLSSTAVKDSSKAPVGNPSTIPQQTHQTHESLLNQAPRPSRYSQERYPLNEESFANMNTRAFMFDAAFKQKNSNIREVIHSNKCQWIAIASLEDKESAQFFKMLNVLYTHDHSCERLQILTDGPSTFADRIHKNALQSLFGELAKFGVRSKATLKQYFTTRDSTEQTLTNLAELINAPQLNSKALTTKPLLVYLEGGTLKNFWTSDVQDDYQEFVNLLNHFHN